MKPKIVISVILASIACVENAYGLTTGVLCQECRAISSPAGDDTPAYGPCLEYGNHCCEPCTIEPGDITLPVCDESKCSGSTTTSLDGNCEEIETKGCNDNVCSTSSSLRCIKGYYGTPQLERFNFNKCTGCEPCPSSGDIAGTTAGPGVTAITECYLPFGTAFSDSIGSGVYDGNCYYTN